ncbi:MAG TPA: hypothetical protein VFT80_09240, partial [Actinomycetota bacterium]|nr:hypothetical protein [Actinomycetota bacterium]
RRREKPAAYRVLAGLAFRPPRLDPRFARPGLSARLRVEADALEAADVPLEVGGVHLQLLGEGAEDLEERVGASDVLVGGRAVGLRVEGAELES